VLLHLLLCGLRGDRERFGRPVAARRLDQARSIGAQPIRASLFVISHQFGIGFEPDDFSAERRKALSRFLPPVPARFRLRCDRDAMPRACPPGVQRARSYRVLALGRVIVPGGQTPDFLALHGQSLPGALEAFFALEL
jgi:hypothetical protein